MLSYNLPSYKSFLSCDEVTFFKFSYYCMLKICFNNFLSDKQTGLFHIVVIVYSVLKLSKRKYLDIVQLNLDF